MAKFQVTTTQASYVSWTYIIEAENEQEALSLYYDGDHGDPVSTEIGDSVDCCDSTEEVSKIED